MDAEQIVRALAANDPKAFTSFEERVCGLCWAKPTGGDIEDVELDDPARHKPECPWRLAREWLAVRHSLPVVHFHGRPSHRHADGGSPHLHSDAPYNDRVWSGRKLF